MNTHQIHKILSRNPSTKDCFIGCFASDQIPSSIHHFPYCMVVNLDGSWAGGSHWVAIFVPSNITVDYYDSLGDWPPLVPEISKFLGQFEHVNYNRQKLQSELSDACGKHAIYFLCRRCSGMPFGKIIGNLRKCKSGADRLVNEYVRNIFSN